MGKPLFVSFKALVLFIFATLVACSEQPLSVVSLTAMRISASATNLVFDGATLKSQITVVITKSAKPLAGYTPEVEVEQQSGFSFFGFNNTIQSATIVCTDTNAAGESTCDLSVAPPTGSPETLIIKIAGKTLTFTSPLVIYPAPTLTAISDSTLSFDQGQNLTLTGTQFRTGMKVYIDSALCTPVTVLSVTSAQCTTPVHVPGGPYDVELLMPDEQEVVLAAAVSFQDVTDPEIELTLVPPARSNQASFDFEFTASDNTTIVANLTYECRVNSGSWTSCTSPYTATGFNNGVTNIFSVRATDEAGNIGVDSHSWIYDTTAPTITIASQTGLTPSPSSSLAARSVTFGGTDIAQYKYTVIQSGTCDAVDYSALAAQNISSPTINFTPSGDASYTVCAIGKDTAGNWQADADATSSSTVVIDTVVDAFSGLVIAPTSPGNDNMPTVSGTTEVGASVELYKQASCGGSSIATGTANGAGEFSLTPSTSIGASASYSLSVKATDGAGNSLCSSTVAYLLDVIKPTVTLTTLTGAQYIRGGQNTDITWTAADTGGSGLATNPIKLEYSLNAGSSWSTIVASTADTSPYTWNMPGFNSSTARIRVTAVDAAGNSEFSSSTSSFVIDSSAPLLSLDSLTGGQLLKGGSSAAINWTATDANFGSNPIALDYSSDGGSNWTSITAATANSGTFTWPVPNVDASNYRIKVTAVDRVSQTTWVASASNIKIDKSEPVVTLTSLTGGQAVLSGSDQIITWTATDANFGGTPITLEYSDDSGVSWQSIVSNIANSGSYTWATPSVTSLNFRVRITATDMAGWISSSSSSSNFSISPSAPNLTQTTLTSPYYSNSDTTVDFGGDCEVPLDITVSGAATDTITCLTGTWTWAAPTVATDGVRDYTFSQTNGVLTTSRTARWVRDTDVPSIEAVEINSGVAYTPTPTVTVAVTTLESGISVRLANAATGVSSCQAQYADNNWFTQSSTTVTYNHLLSPSDDLKKVCVWAKDQSGNISVITPAAGTEGIDMDTINYSSGNAPTVSQFEIINNSGSGFQGTQNANANDPLKITWAVGDVEGLSNSPVFLDYTLDGTTWIPIEAGYGSLSGNPTSYAADYYGFSAPVNTFFRIRLRVKDVAGNTSLEYLSKPFNTYPWSVFAGSRTRGVGGSAKSASVLKVADNFSTFTINPKNGDVYYIDSGYGIFKVSAATGLVSKITSAGTADITGAGTLTPSSIIGSWDTLLFDNNGYLYLTTAGSNSSNNIALITRRVIRINPDTLDYTTYLAGGGTHYGNSGTTPANVFVMGGSGFAFDESNSLYFVTSCTPGTWPAGAAFRLLKIAQNPDGTAGAVSVVGGDCIQGNPTSGLDATATSFGGANDPHVTQLAVWDNGKKIYYYPGTGSAVYKILNGKVYTTTIPVVSGNAIMAYNPVDTKLYLTNGTLKAFTPNLSGADGEAEDVTKRINGNATGDNCADDGIPIADACVVIYGLQITPAGKVFFTDGRSRAFALLRYVDESQNIQTLVGSKSYSGNGKDPSLTRGMFGGIYYKKASELLPLVYPEGLYFTEYQGGVFGYFSKDLGVSVNLWGNQSGNAAPATTGASIGPGLSIGPLTGNAYGDLKAMIFDSSGRPWLRYNGYRLITIDENKQLIVRSGAAGTQWTSVAPGTNPQGYSLDRYGGLQNFTFSNNKLFLLGLRVLTSTDPSLIWPRMRLWDYDNGTVVHLMGNVLQDQTDEQLTEGSLENKPINGCYNAACSIQYVSDQDRLYWAERKKMRYIGKPMTPANHTLVDLFDTDADIQNFIVSEDGKYIFYTKDGALYCHAISAANNSSICKNNVNDHIKLGPPDGLDVIGRGPNQMTWKNNLTLFISTQQGEIYQYLVYH